ncbi:hypothetical protein OG1RF_10833 [Enterococcus faecalis OG1RF]|nr:hypothetical protein OG1RF_10833 [Enterococcus faecalis OG1RF]
MLFNTKIAGAKMVREKEKQLKVFKVNYLIDSLYKVFNGIFSKQALAAGILKTVKSMI